MFATFALVLGLLALLAAPLDIAFAVQRRLVFGGSVTLRWLYGLVRVRLPSIGRAKERKSAKPRRRKKRGGKSRLARRGLVILRNAALRRRALDFAVRVLRSFRMRDVALRVRLGLDDPADTGMLWGLAGPAVALLEARPDADVDLELDFVEACFEGDARGTVRVIPLELACVTVMFLLSPPMLWAVGTLLLGGRR